MSNISILDVDVNVSLGDRIIEDYEGYVLLQEAKETAFSLCKNCFENNFFNVKATSFKCSNCGQEQSA